MHFKVNLGATDLANYIGHNDRARQKELLSYTRPRTDGDDPCQVALMGFGNFGGGIAQVIAGNMIGARRENFNPIHVFINPHTNNPEKHGEALNRVRHINSRHRSAYLPDVELHRGLHATLDMDEAIRGKSQLLVAVPSVQLLPFLMEFAESFARAWQQGDIPPNVAVTSLIKGLPEIIDSSHPLVDDHLRKEAKERLIFPAEIIGYVLQQKGVRVGGSDGVRILSMHGAAFGTDIAKGAPYSLTIGNDSTSKDERAEQLFKIMSKAKAFVEVAPGKGEMVELGAVGKNFVALLANFVSGYCFSKDGYSHQGALMRAYENGINEVALLANLMRGTTGLNPINDFQAQREDAQLSTFSAVTGGATRKKPTPGRNADFGVRLASARSIDSVLDEMAAERGGPVTVESLGIVSALHTYLKHRGWLEHFPLVNGLAIALALRDSESTIPEIKNLSEVELDRQRGIADCMLYKLAVQGEHTSFALLRS